MSTIAKFFRDCFTQDKAGEVFSLAHTVSAGGFSSFTGMAVYHTVTTHQFDPTAVGTGMAAVLASCGALIFANSKSGDPK